MGKNQMLRMVMGPKGKRDIKSFSKKPYKYLDASRLTPFYVCRVLPSLKSTTTNLLKVEPEVSKKNSNTD